LIGSTGFLILVARLLFRRQGSSRPSLLDCLTTLTGYAVLLGTVGGFGSVFNFLATPLIRQYNRLSIFIAFFAFAAVALLLDGIAARHVRSAGAKLLFSALLGGLLVVGILDQTAPSLLPIYRAVKQEYRNDAEFVSRMEAELPSGACVFQLPC